MISKYQLYSNSIRNIPIILVLIYSGVPIGRIFNLPNLVHKYVCLYYISVCLPGQLAKLQTSTDVPLPIQYVPPSVGVGVSHCLVLRMVPSPHEVEHVDQLPHPPQPPSTGTINK